MKNTIARIHTQLLNLSSQERGSLTVEQVIMTVALLALATLVVAAITAAVKSRLGGIV